ncbi:MAG: hypothetical protein ACM3NQ_02900 [Bacteroidales bacterium]
MNGTGRSVAGLPRRVAVIYGGLFVAALVLYIGLWRNAQVVDGDTAQYQAVAADLLDGHLDVLHDRTIGYPLLLVLTGSAHHATLSLLVVSLLMHLASVWLLAVTLRKAGVGPGWLIAFGALLVLPPFVEPAAWLMTENLAQFVLVVALACLVHGFATTRVALLLASGLAFGYAALTRPAYQAVAVVLSAGLLLLPVTIRSANFAFRDAVKAAGLVVAGSALVVGSMAYVNYARFQYFGLVPSIGFHLTTKTWTFFEQLPDEYATVRDAFVARRNIEVQRRGSTPTQVIWNAKKDLLAATGLTGPQLSRYLLKANLVLIRKAPIAYLQEVARSLALYWFPQANLLASMGSSTLRLIWAALQAAIVAFFFLQAMVLGSVVAFDASRRRCGGRARTFVSAIQATAPQVLAYLLAIGIVFYTMLLSCFLDIGEPRQRRPTELLIVFVCVLGAHLWRQSAAQVPPERV